MIEKRQDLSVHGLEKLILSRCAYYSKWHTDSIKSSVKIVVILFPKLEN